MPWAVAVWEEKDRRLSDVAHRIEVIREISDDDYERFVEAERRLHRHTERAVHRLVHTNYETLMRFLDEVAEFVSTHPTNEWPIGETDRGLKIRTFNWLLSVRAFLDHAETSLKRDFGSSSEEARVFSEMCSELFDETFSYRFIYKLRNYTQHCGFPPIVINVHHDSSAEPKRTMSVHFSRQELVSGFDGWGPVGRELLNRPERIEALVHLEAMMKCIDILQLTIQKLEMPKLEQDVEVIQRLRAIAEGYHGAPCLIETSGFHEAQTTGEDDDLGFQSHMLPEALIEEVSAPEP